MTRTHSSPQSFGQQLTRIRRTDSQNFFDSGCPIETPRPTGLAQRLHAVCQSMLAQFVDARALSTQLANRAVGHEEFEDGNPSRKAGVMAIATADRLMQRQAGCPRKFLGEIGARR